MAGAVLLFIVLTVTIGPISSYRHNQSNSFYLNVAQPVSWHENKPPGPVVRFDVGDDDEDVDHEVSFKVAIADDADAAISRAFAIKGSSDSLWTLMALETFDHERRNNYIIPIIISDVASSPPRSSVVKLYVHIEDVNEHPMTSATLHTTVYNYNNFIAGQDIGHVYVDDGDHSDYFDKEFHWHPNTTASKYFNVAEIGGFISAKSKVPAGIHTLNFLVVDDFRDEKAEATVVIDVRNIAEEDIRNSGSLRLSGLSLEDFVTPMPPANVSRRLLLQQELAAIFGVVQHSVEIFSAFNHLEGDSVAIDVRYFVKDKAATHLNALASDQRRRLESVLGAVIVMVGIDECADEKTNLCGNGCINRLQISDVPYHSFTRTASFVGVKAKVFADCSCPVMQQQQPLCASGHDTLGHDTLGHDTLGHDTLGHDTPGRPRCPFGFRAPRCDVSRHASFSGGNWAWYHPLASCSPSQLTLNFDARSTDGILLYSGPRNIPAADDSRHVVSDYVAIELQQGRPVLYLNLGAETTKLQFGKDLKSLLDDHVHQLEVQWNSKSVQMSLDQCPMRKSDCWVSSPVGGRRRNLLNTANEPVQLGGVDFDLNVLKDAFGWQSLPTSNGFYGCIRNLTFNGYTFNLAAPVHLHGLGDIATGDGVAFGVSGIAAIVSLIGIVLVVALGFLIAYYLKISAFEQYKVLRENSGTKPTATMTSFEKEMKVIYAQNEKLVDALYVDE